MSASTETATPNNRTTQSSLDVRLANGKEDIFAAQQLRYKVFYEDMGAVADPEVAAAKRDFDTFDDYCDHLLVTDGDDVVGTYRLLRRSVAQEFQGFYSASEFDLAKLAHYPGEIVELGRSCVDPKYRGKAVMQLLWRGIADYITRYNITLMFGCASFPGTDLDQMKTALSYLYHHHSAPKDWSPKAVESRFMNMKLLKKSQIDARQALREMPPLIKGYLRVGGVIGNGAVIDHQFNTVDVCLLAETGNVAGRYQRHFLQEKDPLSDNNDASSMQ